MKPETAKNPPLSSATLQILLALAGGDLHGYGIIKEVARNSDGHYKLGPGTLYDNLKKLMDAGLVSDAPLHRNANHLPKKRTGVSIRSPKKARTPWPPRWTAYKPSSAKPDRV